MFQIKSILTGILISLICQTATAQTDAEKYLQSGSIKFKKGDVNGFFDQDLKNALIKMNPETLKKIADAAKKEQAPEDKKK